MLKAMVTHAAVLLVSVTAGSAFAQAAAGQRQRALTPRAQPAQEQPVEASGKVEISSTECKFGEVFQGAEAIKSYTVKNVGKDPLTLSVRSSCGCTTPSKPKSPLAAGESTEFTIQYRTSAPGEFHKNVWLTTSDPDQPRITIPVEGVVKPLFSISPGDEARFLYRFEDASNDPNQTVTITLTNNSKEPVHVKMRDGQKLGRYDVTLHEAEAGQKYELRVHTVPPLENGSNHAVVMLDTDNAKVPLLRLSLEAVVEPRVTVSPQKLLAISGTSKITRSVFVKYRKADPIKIESATSDIDGVEVEVLDKSNAPENATAAYHQLRVTLPDFDKIPEQGGKLIIKTDDKGEYATIEIPIQRYVRPVARAPQAGRAGTTGQASAAPAQPQPKASDHTEKTEPAKPAEPAQPAQPEKPAEPAND